MTTSLKREYIRCFILFQGFFVPLLCGLSTFPNFVAGIAHENSPLNWFSTVIFWSLGIFTFLIWSAPNKPVSENIKKIPEWFWIAFSFGFFFLSLDDQFQFHERFRDHEINPNTNLSIPFVERGEFQIPFYILVGFIIYRFLIKRIERKWIFNTLTAGIIFGIAACGLDTLTFIHKNFSIVYTQTIEECLEYAAVSCWLSAFTEYYFDLLDR